MADAVILELAAKRHAVAARLAPEVVAELLAELRVVTPAMLDAASEALYVLTTVRVGKTRQLRRGVTAADELRTVYLAMLEVALSS